MTEKKSGRASLNTNVEIRRNQARSTRKEKNRQNLEKKETRVMRFGKE